MDPSFPNHAHRLLKTHETLLRDPIRNRAFYSALERAVHPGSAVLDIGSGSGVWAISAAKLGATRVLAIERDGMLVDQIRKAAVEHGVEDRVEVVCGSSFDIGRDEKFDVVVSETIGYLGYDENIVAIMLDVRHRFLRDGGVIIPEGLALCVAAGRLQVRQDMLPVRLPFELKGFQRLSLHSPTALKRATDITLLTDPRVLVSTDLNNAFADPDLRQLTAGWEVDEIGSINCFCVWVECTVLGDIRFDTRQTTSWLPTIYRIDPLPGGQATLKFRLSLTPTTNTWTVDGSGTSASYSPELAARSLLAASSENISLVPATDNDAGLMFELYRSSRESEVAHFGWGADQIRQFLRTQFDSRASAYRMQSPDAEDSVIMLRDTAVGRLIVDRSGQDLTLIDIAVLPAFQGLGIGSVVIRRLQSESIGAGRAIKLHVDNANPAAAALYSRLGFSTVAEGPVYSEMKWKPQ